jgi:lactate permease
MFASDMGWLGPFITRSNIVFDIFFAQYQWNLADSQKLSRVMVLAAHGVERAIANMICAHNIVAMCAASGRSNQEGDIIKRILRLF